MSGALLEKIPLLGGEFEICRFANKPRFWWFRQYIPAGPNNKRTYIKRSLKTEDSHRQSVVPMRSGAN